MSEGLPPPSVNLEFRFCANLRCPQIDDEASQQYWNALWIARLSVFENVFPWVRDSIMDLAGLAVDTPLVIAGKPEHNLAYVAAHEIYSLGTRSGSDKVRAIHERQNLEWKELTNLPPLATPEEWWTAATRAGASPPKEFSAEDFERYAGCIIGWAKDRQVDKPANSSVKIDPKFPKLDGAAAASRSKGRACDAVDQIIEGENVSAQLPTTDEEAAAIQPAIADFLRSIPATWAEFDLDRLTELQEKALFLLTAAGMVERRGWIRTTIANHPTCFELRFQATGEAGYDMALEHATAMEFQTWGDAWREWCAGETKERSPFQVHSQKPQEWRLTAQGESARDELNGANPGAEPSIVFDFVLKRGLFGPGYWMRRLTPARRLLTEEDVRVLEGHLAAGRNLVVLSRPPVGGSGQLLESRTAEQPSLSQSVSVTNWGEGASAFANMLDKLLVPMFNAMTKSTQGVPPPLGTVEQQSGNSAEQVGNSKSTPFPSSDARYRFKAKGEYWHVCFDDEEGMIKELNGMGYISRLLGQPRTRMRAEDLKSVVAQLTNNPSQKVLSPNSAEVVDGHVSALQPAEASMADETAVEACEGRLIQIEGERESARHSGEVEKIDRLDEEELKIKHYLSKVKALGRKLRRIPDRGRSTFNSVRQAIVRVVERLQTASPPLIKLAEHLRKCIESGNGVFEYRPSSPVPDWDL